MPAEALTIATGQDEYLEGTREITSNFFGVRYGAFRSFSRFETLHEDFDGGLLMWPGGTEAEKGLEKFGFEYDGLYNMDETYGKADLTDLFTYCNENNMALGIPLPTARYRDDTETLREDVRSFLAELLSGQYGALPERLILEAGNEWYHNIKGSDAAEDYGRLASVYGEEISKALSDPAINLIGADNIDFSVQAGRNVEENTRIISSMSDEALSAVDLITTHRFPVLIQGADKVTGTVADMKADWDEAILDAGGEETGIFLSAYNAASYTRGEALKDYIAETGRDADEIDLDARTDLAFEQYWQDRLDYMEYGNDQAEMIMELFTSYSKLDMDAAATYGADMVHPARLNLQVDDQDYEFVGGTMQDMMAESLVGTRALASADLNDGDDDSTSAYIFEGDDKLVAFLFAPDFDGESYDLSLDLECAEDWERVWSETLTSEAPENWQEIFDIPDVEGIDMTPEAESYALGVRGDAEITLSDGSISVTFTEPGEVIRLSFAKTEEGIADITSWENGEGVDLSLLAASDSSDTGASSSASSSGSSNTSNSLWSSLGGGSGGQASSTEDESLEEAALDEEDPASAASDSGGGDEAGESAMIGLALLPLLPLLLLLGL